MTRRPLLLPLLLCLPLGLPSMAAQAACVAPLDMPPAQAPVTAWNDVVRGLGWKRDNDNISNSQHLPEDGMGDLRLTYDAVTLDARGETPAAVLARFRKSFEGALRVKGYRMEAFDADSRAKWQADKPTGALLVFALPGYQSPTNKLGALVLSCFDRNTFMLNYVAVDQRVEFDNGGELGGQPIGWHPVVGNRSFGVVQNPNGSVTLFMKSATRRNGRYAPNTLVRAPDTLNLEVQMWQGLLENFRASEAARHPRDVLTHQQDVPLSVLVAQQAF